MFRYPWTNLHELNLGWALHKLKELSDDGDCVFVRPEEFPESSNPVADAVQKAADDGKMVLLSGVYDVPETITVPQGMIIIGTNNAELVSMQQNLPGFCPTTIFSMESNTIVYNVVFNGNRPDGASQSIIPSDLQPGETFGRAPLVLIQDCDTVSFSRCIFKKYDSNRTSANPWMHAVVGAQNSVFINMDRCLMFDCYREGFNFTDCGLITISGCYFSMQGQSLDVYTEIGLLNTDEVLIESCQILKADGVTTSLINAMGNDITIKDCYLYSKSSVYGVDYGNEIEAGFSCSNLLIKNCRIHCHINAKSTVDLVAAHDNVVLDGCEIDGSEIDNQAGVVYVVGYAGEHFEITNCHFYGTLSAPVYDAIRIAPGTSTNTIISGCVFDQRAIWLNGSSTGLVIKDNVFNARVITQEAVLDTAEYLKIIGCQYTSNNRFGTGPAGCLMEIILIGCSFRVGTTTSDNITVDSSLSYVGP